MSGEQNSCPPSETSCGNFHVEEEGSYPYSILNSPEQGNYLVASRDVAAGEVLFRVEPLGVGGRGVYGAVVVQEDIVCSSTVL